jgi:hypothetical protein
MMIRNSKKKDEEPDLEVNSGKIKRTNQYKYLGDMYDEKGTNESKIKNKGEKIDLMINNINREGSEKKVGKAAVPIRIMLAEIVITPTILSSTETWHNISVTEQQAITSLHQKTLTRILQLPRTTPYKGIIAELNIIPFIETIWYKKFMWYHRLMNSDDTRVAKKKLMDQMKGRNNWYNEIQQYATDNNINIKEQLVKEWSYQQYKSHVKEKIRQKINKELEIERRNKKKLRWIIPGKRQKYIDQCTISEVTKIMKIRLHMVKVRDNYGGGKCRKCQKADETTEHIPNCITDGAIKFEEEKIEDVKWLKTMIHLYQRFEEENPEQENHKEAK